MIALEQVTIGVEWLHFHGINNVHSLENLFALSLIIQKTSDLITESGGYRQEKFY